MSIEIETGDTFAPTGFAEQPSVVTVGNHGVSSLRGPRGGLSGAHETIVTEISDRTKWRRVPPGYIIPSLAEWLDAAARLYAARNAMLADPETGTKGVGDCICEMARMAGIEVPT